MIISSESEMINFWKKIIADSNKILLYWDLWVWKTTFVKWVLKWLWFDYKQVNSPTYTYLNIYEQEILHIDMYRLLEFEDLVEKWILDLINNFSFCIIEWPKFEENIDYSQYIKIDIEKISENERSIKIRD